MVHPSGFPNPSEAGWKPVIGGWSPWTADRLLAAVLEGTPVDQLPGDFTLAAQRGQDALLVTSLCSCRPYYWTTTDDRLVHGTDLFEVAREAGLRWVWNDQAVRSVALLRQPMGDQTLHPAIRRMPQGTVLRARGAAVTVTRSDALLRAISGPRGTMDQALDALVEVVEELPDEGLVLPTTAGLDSRALLAVLLHLGRRPELGCAGTPESTDRVVACKIAADLGLPCHLVDLSADDYLEHGPRIARATGGSYPAADWHAYMIFRGLSDLGSLAVKGTNGELARTFYTDHGIVARAMDAPPFSTAWARFALNLRRARDAYARPIALVDPERDGRSVRSFARAMAASCDTGTGTLNSLDLFYVRERLRGFVGQGVRLADLSMPVAGPFLDARWALAAARLPRSAKLGSAFHRHVIARLAPNLLQYRTARETPLRPTPPRGYWLRRYDAIGYSPFADVTQRADTAATVIESSGLDRFASRSEREAIVATRDSASIDLLLTLHFAAQEGANLDRAARVTSASEPNHAVVARLG